MVAYSNYWRILGLFVFTILWPAKVQCSFIPDAEQAGHGIAQHIGTEPPSVTVPEGIMRGEVGSTSEDHIAPIDGHLVAPQKTKEEHQVEIRGLIAKIPQLRDISTIQARNELRDPSDRNQRLINLMKADFDSLRVGFGNCDCLALEEPCGRLRLIHDQIFWSVKHEFFNLKGMGLGFWISVPGVTVDEDKNPYLIQIINQIQKAIKSREQEPNAPGEHLQEPSDTVEFKPATNESKFNSQHPPSANMKSEETQNSVKKIVKEHTFVLSGTEQAAETSSDFMLDSGTSQEVMKNWNRGIVQDLKKLYKELLSMTDPEFHRFEANKRLILQTVDFMYKHEMIDVDCFKWFYDTDQVLESAGKNMVWYFMYKERKRVSHFSWNLNFFLDSWYSSHYKNMHEVLDQKQRIKFEYAVYKFIFLEHPLYHGGTRRKHFPICGWYDKLFQENKTGKNDVTLNKFLEKHPDNNPKQSLRIQRVLDEMIGDLKDQDIDESSSNNIDEATRIVWRLESQVLGFIQENYKDFLPTISPVDNQLEDKLRLITSSTQFLGKLENIMIYLKEEFPDRDLWITDLELKQPRKNSMTRLEELETISEYIDMIHEEHNQRYSDIKIGHPLAAYLQREDVHSSVELLKQRIKENQGSLTIGRGKYWFKQGKFLFGQFLGSFS
ncbi:hypothetical protein MJO29_007712 [Puccinia striiformis f. sp. tritici]|uniref:Secreted protein n=1 Tax=Puccinia striiformis f. sp. tritici PST-78 TaxID=1165861 RepID=A0A0L0V3Q4_9BASI|nr:hypothetical protein MJO29_007712 [Puccinia striiformis f. sp. tritici]KNE93922.1 hypothetical protein PSTG_12725 [Puccinia striiformis f. sp. tritici PST-78]KNE93923.1 hypothetical protein, variant [Puccinia striiformis f. sp. tritici PST-78]